MLGLAFIDDTEPVVGVTLIISDSLAGRRSYTLDAVLVDNGWMVEAFAPYTCQQPESICSYQSTINQMSFRASDGVR
jgi:hypothetical protein